ncbi:MAG TPA: hypothetical protein EYG03_24790 [Planctomycetes bacterium]|nr:hypothetical protein [Planctomycetota bacterium]
MVQTNMNSVDNTSPRHRISRRFSRVLIVLFSLLVIPGCNYFILLGYLIGGPPQLQPLFEKETKKSFTDRNIRVAVVCYAPDDLTKFHDNIDQMLASRLASMLYRHQIEIINPDVIQAWMVNNPDWDTAAEVGAEFDVNYVVYVDITDFALYERDSTSLFRGRCEALVSVYEMETDGSGRRIFDRDVQSVFPTEVPRSASEVSYETFRNEYFFRLADEIGRLFYPYGHGDDIVNAT